MPRLLNSQPKLRRHVTGQAFVQVGGKQLYLGKYGSRAAKLAYDAFLLQWITAGRPAHIDLIDEVTINRLVRDFWRNCKASLSRGEQHPMKSALRMLRQMFGKEPVGDFGPKKLRELRDAMIEKGWVRTSINKQVHRVRRAFRWGVTEQLVPAEVWHSLLALDGLRVGRSKAKEGEHVLPSRTRCLSRHSLICRLSSPTWSACSV